MPITPDNPWDPNYSVFRSVSDMVNGDAVTGALSADWNLTIYGAGQSPRDIRVATAGVMIEPGCAYVPSYTPIAHAYCRYEPSAGVRDIYFRASLSIRPGGINWGDYGTNSGTASLMVMNGTVPFCKIDFICPDAGGTGSPPVQICSAEGNVLTRNIIYDPNKWYRVGMERTRMGISFYWNQTRFDYWGDVEADEKMSRFGFINANALSCAQKQPLSSSIYLLGSAGGGSRFLGPTLYMSAFASPYFAETQYIGPEMFRPPSLPQYPINLPSGGDLAMPYTGFTPIDLSLADYHRYKNVRSAMNIYNNIRLDQ